MEGYTNTTIDSIIALLEKDNKDIDAILSRNILNVIDKKIKTIVKCKYRTTGVGLKRFKDIKFNYIKDYL